MARIVVMVKGGMVEAVIADEPVDILIADYDLDDLAEEQGAHDPQGTSIAHGYPDFSVQPEDVEAIFAEFATR